MSDRIPNVPLTERLVKNTDEYKENLSKNAKGFSNTVKEKFYGNLSKDAENIGKASKFFGADKLSDKMKDYSKSLASKIPDTSKPKVDVDEVKDTVGKTVKKGLEATDDALGGYGAETAAAIGGGLAVAGLSKLHKKLAKKKD